ncbi:MAG: MBL fold metallo-hydrolase [Phycisphaerae bacterium]|nr:MBL fold metallo-hydrolase [Phycisphaerae bacterium]
MTRTNHDTLRLDFPVHLGAPITEAVASPTAFCVLASSSSGNCSALIHGEGLLRRVTLIDCGLSPRRTRLLLARMGLDFSAIDDILVTHLDGDHFYSGWIKALPRHTWLHIHARHLRRAAHAGVDMSRVTAFEDPFTLRCGVHVRPTVLSHDEWGVVAFRLDVRGVSLGYATDLGRASASLIKAMQGVDVLAIESNYCRRMQVESDRPEQLKERIMGGFGHLSNEECAAAVRKIQPRDHVVLLHLSRQCNSPETAAAHHAGAGYRLTVADAEWPMAPIVLG